MSGATDLEALVGPDIVELWRWSQHGRCYTPGARAGETIWMSADPVDQAEAKAVCAECPVREDCLHWAVKHHEHGVWGGLSTAERERLPYRYADCAHCGEEFEYRMARGRPLATCSDACHKARREEQVQRWYSENPRVEKPGHLLTLGHGTLRRYRDGGCRCATCKRVSREERRRYPRSQEAKAG